MRSKGILYIVLFISLASTLCTSCIDRDKYAPKPYVRALEIVKISDSEFMHISYLKDGNGGYIGCNGYVYIENGEALIFDTPINDTLGNQLINYIEEDLKARVKGIVVTHAHTDAAGALKAFHKRAIPSYGSTRTASILAKDSLYISNPFEITQEIRIGNTGVENRFFGEGHTADNIVSYIPKVKTLVGGCIIKPKGGLKGNIKDANLTSWSQTVRAIKEAYPEVETVVPGHGRMGGTELLDYTISLFDK